MKTASPLLLPLLRTRTQGEVLAWIVLRPDEKHTLSEIAQAVGTSVPTVAREVDRLAKAGFVISTKSGNQRIIAPTTNHPVYRPLADLMAVTFGPIGVLRAALGEVPGIEQAFIYGSWAARYAEQPGPVPNDLDVMVVGTPDRAAVDAAVEAAEKQLRREVAVRVVSPEAWNADDGSFKRTIAARPTVSLIGRAA